jgi:RecA/RadA recombinase
MSIFDTLAKEAKNDYAKLVSDGITTGDEQKFIGTGSYILNALLSGSIYGGIPDNRVTAIAGEQATGKTFYAIGIAKHFLDANPEGAVFYFDSEAAATGDLFKNRGLDADRVWHFPVDTIEEFRTQIIRILDNLLKTKEEDRKPLLIVLDSLGMLASSKELEDALADKQVRDMTKTQSIKSVFRIITSKLGKLKVPMIVTNHTYKTMNMYGDQSDMGGGSGLKYAASTIMYLSKSKEKDGTDVVGNIIKVKANKSRFTKENSQVATRLFFDSRGLDKYYGLLELGEKYSIFLRKGNRILVGESSVYPSAILADPEKYFTEEIMEKLDWAANQEFKYGTETN